MLLPLLALLTQTFQTPTVAAPAGNPVHLGLDTSSPLTRGSPVRVYVQAGQGGHLVVLHRRTDARIEVLFPVSPTDDPAVTPGTYEIRGPRDRAAFVVSEPDGTGMILAALTVDEVRVDEFVHEASWDPNALVPTWRGADAEGALSDIVQRMLGDGTFNYDFVTYTVAPPQPMLASLDSPDSADATSTYESYSPCPDCTFIGYGEIYWGPGFFCDDFAVGCGARRAFRHAEPRCQPFSICTAAQPTPAIALTLRPASAARINAGGAKAGGGARYAGATPPATRTREPVHQVPVRSKPTAPKAIPPGPGRQLAQVGAAPRPERSLTTEKGAVAPRSHVRYTALSAPSNEGRVGWVGTSAVLEPRPSAPESGSGFREGQGVGEARGIVRAGMAMRSGGGGGGAMHGVAVAGTGAPERVAVAAPSVGAVHSIAPAPGPAFQARGAGRSSAVRAGGSRR